MRCVEYYMIDDVMQIVSFYKLQPPDIPMCSVEEAIVMETVMQENQSCFSKKCKVTTNLAFFQTSTKQPAVDFSNNMKRKQKMWRLKNLSLLRKNKN